MADLASKRALADGLRTELAALRLARENGAQAGHAAAQEVALDEEVERLRREVERERASLAATGTVEDAAAIMEAAARAESEESDETVLDVKADDTVSASEGIVETTATAQPSDGPLLVSPLLVDSATTDEVK